MPFHLFAELPAELRFQIWKFTFPRPRYQGPLNPREPRLSMRKRRGPYREDPVALKVNKESRQIAFNNYTRRDISLLRFWEIRDDVKYCSYIDFKHDIAFIYDIELWLPQRDEIGSIFFSGHEMGKIERLWISHDNVIRLGRDLATWLRSWLPQFLSLKEIIIEVKGLEKCKGIVRTGGQFQTVAEALQDVREIGIEKLYRLQERLTEMNVRWELPVLEVEDRDNLVFDGRLGG